METPHQDPTQILETLGTERVFPLLAEVRRKRLLDLLNRIINGPPERLGVVSVGQEKLELRRKGLPAVAVLWSRPFVTRVSRWPGPDGATEEIHVAVRVSGGQARDPWAAMRTVWPSDCVDEEIPLKQNIAPFLHPKHFPCVWSALRAASALHDAALFPDRIKLDVTSAQIALLRSIHRPPKCVACDSLNILSIGHKAYRCVVCGYEGGEGFAIMQETVRQKLFDAMSAQARRKSARADLEEAVFLLGAVADNLDGCLAMDSSKPDLKSMAAAEGLRIIRVIFEVDGHLGDAAYKDPSVRHLVPRWRERLQVDKWQMAEEFLSDSATFEPGTDSAELRNIAVAVRRACLSQPPV